MNVFASVSKSTTKDNTFTGYGDFGIQAWAVHTVLTGQFGTYTTNKAIEKLDIYSSVARHNDNTGIGDGSYSVTLFTYKGSTNIGTYYPPSGFTSYSIIYDPNTTWVYLSHKKTINDTGTTSQTMKIQANYSFFISGYTPVNSWNSSTSITY